MERDGHARHRDGDAHGHGRRDARHRHGRLPQHGSRRQCAGRDTDAQGHGRQASLRLDARLLRLRGFGHLGRRPQWRERHLRHERGHAPKGRRRDALRLRERHRASRGLVRHVCD